jgi:hypothetical protein
VNNGPTVTDWIAAVSGIFAAVGTVGAVAVALWQVLRQNQRQVDVMCRHAVMAPDSGLVHALALRATNVGLRPVKLTMAHLTADDGRTLFSPFVPYSDDLPIVLQDGESAEVFWYDEKLEDVRQSEGFAAYRTAFFLDVLGNSYVAPYPGVKVKRRGFRRRKVYEIPDASRT